MKKIFTFALIGIMCAGCSDANTAQRALDNMGFTDIETLGWTFWGSCGDNGGFKTKFRAKNAKGKVVTGLVCNGWIQPAVVKFD